MSTSFAHKPTIQNGLVFGIDGGNQFKSNNITSNVLQAKADFVGVSESTNQLQQSTNSDFKFGDEDFTICGWFRIEGSAGGNIGVLSRQNSWTLYYAGSAPKTWRFAILPSGTSSPVTVAVADKNVVLNDDNYWPNAQFFIVAGYDTSTNRAFISANRRNSHFELNNFNTSNIVGGPGSNSNEITMGGFGSSYVSSQAFNGQIWNLMFYDRVLTYDEANTLFIMGRSLEFNELSLPQKEGMISFFKLNETGATKTDVVRGNTFTEISSSDTLSFGTNNTYVENLKGYNDVYPTINGPTNNGDSIGFDGTNDRIHIDNVLKIVSGQTTGTWELWIKPTGTPTGTQSLVSFGDTDDNELLYIYRRSDNRWGAFCREAGVNQWQIDSNNSTLVNDTWAHLVLVQNGTTVTLFLDGVEEDFSVGTTTDTTTWFSTLATLDNGRIGSRSFLSRGEETFFNGLVGYVRLYDRALSAAEIKQNYDASKWRFIQRSYPNTT